FTSELRLAETRFNAQLQSQAALDVDLRTRREGVYADLWRMGISLSKWPRNDALTYSDLDALVLKLREWYFDKLGGLWLSAAARAAYGRLQDELNAPRASTGPDLVRPDGPDYERLMTAF